jgi:hypothetical protein
MYKLFELNDEILFELKASIIAKNNPTTVRYHGVTNKLV